MEKRNWNDRKLKDGILQWFIYLSTLLTVMILAVIIGFILYKGIPELMYAFTRQWDDKTTFVNVVQKTDSGANKEAEYVPSLGITLVQDGENVVIAKIDSNSPVKAAVNMKKQAYALKVKDIITKYGDVKIEKMTVEKAAEVMKDGTGTVRIKVTRPGGGIVPMLVSTIYIILLSLVIAAPIGISSAIYLNEYAKRGRILSLIRFAIQNLAGIPSIIYGLFGMLLFVQIAKMEYSVLAVL